MEDKRVESMEIDGQQGVDDAVPDGFNTDYLRIIMCGTDRVNEAEIRGIWIPFTISITKF